MMDNLSTTSVNASTTTVTLNLFQGPFTRSSSGHAAQWMLKQVQHDEIVCEITV